MDYVSRLLCSKSLSFVGVSICYLKWFYWMFHIYTDEPVAICFFKFIPSPVRVDTLLMEVPGTPIMASFFEFELKPTEKDSAEPTQHEFQHHIV